VSKSNAPFQPRYPGVAPSVGEKTMEILADIVLFAVRLDI
jgi:hypothetical protein